MRLSRVVGVQAVRAEQEIGPFGPRVDEELRALDGGGAREVLVPPAEPSMARSVAQSVFPARHVFARPHVWEPMGPPPFAPPVAVLWWPVAERVRVL